MPRTAAPPAPSPVRPVAFAIRQRSACIQLAALAVFAALATPFFLGRVYVADDLGEFHLPVRSFYAEQLRRGEAFDWMPSLFGGFYITGEGQLGAYHPLHLALYRWLPLGAAFDLELLLSYPAMFAGTYVLLMRWLSRRDAALFGALLFTFGGFNLLHFVHPNAIAVVAHIPWLLAAIDVALTTRESRHRIRAELAVALLTASQLLLGYPQYVWFSLLASAALVSVRLIQASCTTARVATVGLALLCGVIVSSVQLLPTVHALGESVRRESDPAFRNSGSLHPLNLMQFVAPYLFRTRVVGQNTHELGLYAGAVPAVLLVWLLSRRSQWGRLKPLITASLVCGSLALVLACGEFGGLYELQAWLPLVNRFRFPCRAIVLVQLSIAIAAAAAYVMLSRSQHSTSASRRPLVSTVFVSAFVAVLGVCLWPQYVATPWLIITGPLLIALAAALVAMAERGHRWALTALAIVAAADLAVYGLSYAALTKTADMTAFVASSSLPPDRSGTRVAAPAQRDQLRHGDRILLAGLTRVDGYAGLEPAKQLDYRDPDVLLLAGAEWMLRDEDNTTDGEIKPRWVRLGRGAPRARLATRVVPASEQVEPANLPEHSAIPDRPLELTPSKPGTVEVILDAPGRIVVQTHAPAQQLLVLTESFDSGWIANIDDSSQQPWRVNGDFLGIPVPAGNHQVEFVFRPRSLTAGAIATACGLQLLLGVTLYRLWRVRVTAR